MERCRWEGQNFKPLKEVQRLEEEEEEEEDQLSYDSVYFDISYQTL